MNKNFNNKTAKGLASLVTVIIMLSSILATGAYYNNGITANAVRKVSIGSESKNIFVIEADFIEELDFLNEGWYEIRNGFVFYLDTFNTYAPLYIKVKNPEQQNGLLAIDEYGEIEFGEAIHLLEKVAADEDLDEATGEVAGFEEVSGFAAFDNKDVLMTVELEVPFGSKFDWWGRNVIFEYAKGQWYASRTLFGASREPVGQLDAVLKQINDARQADAGINEVSTQIVKREVLEFKAENLEQLKEQLNNEYAKMQVTPEFINSVQGLAFNLPPVGPTTAGASIEQEQQTAETLKKSENMEARLKSTTDVTLIRQGIIEVQSGDGPRSVKLKFDGEANSWQYQRCDTTCSASSCVCGSWITVQSSFAQNLPGADLPVEGYWRSTVQDLARFAQDREKGINLLNNKAVNDNQNSYYIPDNMRTSAAAASSVQQVPRAAPAPAAPTASKPTTKTDEQKVQDAIKFNSDKSNKANNVDDVLDYLAGTSDGVTRAEIEKVIGTGQDPPSVNKIKILQAALGTAADGGIGKNTYNALAENLKEVKKDDSENLLIVLTNGREVRFAALKPAATPIVPADLLKAWKEQADNQPPLLKNALGGYIGTFYVDEEGYLWETTYAEDGSSQIIRRAGSGLEKRHTYIVDGEGNVKEIKPVVPAQPAAPASAATPPPAAPLTVAPSKGVVQQIGDKYYIDGMKATKTEQGYYNYKGEDDRDYQYYPTTNQFYVKNDEGVYVNVDYVPTPSAPAPAPPSTPPAAPPAPVQAPSAPAYKFTTTPHTGDKPIYYSADGKTTCQTQSPQCPIALTQGNVLFCREGRQCETIPVTAARQSAQTPTPPGTQPPITEKQATDKVKFMAPDNTVMHAEEKGEIITIYKDGAVLGVIPKVLVNDVQWAKGGFTGMNDLPFQGGTRSIKKDDSGNYVSTNTFTSINPTTKALVVTKTEVIEDKVNSEGKLTGERKSTTTLSPGTNEQQVTEKTTLPDKSSVEIRFEKGSADKGKATIIVTSDGKASQFSGKALGALESLVKNDETRRNLILVEANKIGANIGKIEGDTVGDKNGAHLKLLTDMALSKNKDAVTGYVDLGKGERATIEGAATEKSGTIEFKKGDVVTVFKGDAVARIIEHVSDGMAVESQYNNDGSVQIKIGTYISSSRTIGNGFSFTGTKEYTGTNSNLYRHIEIVPDKVYVERGFFSDTVKVRATVTTDGKAEERFISLDSLPKQCLDTGTCIRDVTAVFSSPLGGAAKISTGKKETITIEPADLEAAKLVEKNKASIVRPYAKREEREGRISPAQEKSQRFFAEVERVLTEFQGLGYYATLFFDEDSLLKWRDNVDRVFATAYLGTEYWTSSICGQYLDGENEGIAWAETPQGLAQVAAHIEATRTEPILTPTGTEYIYKITFNVRNGDYGKDPRAPEEMNVNVVLRGQRTVNVFKQPQKVERGSSFGRIGRSAIVKDSTSFYNEICLTFDQTPLRWKTSNGEICNTIVESSGTPTAVSTSSSGGGGSSGAAQGEINDF